jgi:hypothetical protein
VKNGHIVLSRKMSEASGIDFRMPARDKILRGWVVENEKGEAFVLTEKKGTPPHELKPLFDVKLKNGGDR